MTESDFQTFEVVGALVVVLDVDDRIVYWNQACSDLTGYSIEEVRGRRFWSFLLVPEEMEPVRSALAVLRTAGRPSRFANHWVTRGGERRWIARSNTMAKDRDGQPQYFIKTGIDRTESKQAEDRLAGIIGIAADAIISIDDAQRIVMFNHGAEMIFGWSPVEIMGKPLDILIPERFRDVHGRHVRGFASSDETARRMGQRMPAIFGVRKTEKRSRRRPPSPSSMSVAAACSLWSCETSRSKGDVTRIGISWQTWGLLLRTRSTATPR